MDLNLLDCSILWSEAIENFAPPERSSKLPTTSMSAMNSMSSMSSMSSMGSMNSMNSMNSMGSSGLSVELRAWRRESAACESKAQDCV